ncbi:MAG: hypothetical protein SGJ24_19715 [Chloroflexota bacterium]|nr:hypothetical protein [Chloroflexota bacterium]
MMPEIASSSPPAALAEGGGRRCERWLSSCVRVQHYLNCSSCFHDKNKEKQRGALMIPVNLKHLIDQLSADEIDQLREYLRIRDEQSRLRAGTMNIDEFMRGLALMREGLTDEELAEMVRAINGKDIPTIAQTE